MKGKRRSLLGGLSGFSCPNDDSVGSQGVMSE